MSRSQSFVWAYFDREGGKARCKAEGCGSLLAVKSTSTLAYHLEKIHKISKDNSRSQAHHNTASTSTSHLLPQGQEPETEQQHEEPERKKQKTVLDLLKFKSLEETVARLAAEDGITIRQITRSSFIQQALAHEFPRRAIPRSEQGIMALVENFYHQAKDQSRKKLGKMKAEGGKFSATLDEWTSLKNLRFININLHYSTGLSETKYVNLGMVKIDGSCNATDMLRLVSS